MRNVRQFNLDGVVAVGGDDTFVVAERLHRENGLKVIGVPTTIDNDIEGTEYSFGFDSTVNIAMEAIDRIHTTAESHDRVMIVEVMGRNSGWIAVYAGLAGGADIILIPEKPMEIQEICDTIVRRHDRGKDFSIIVVAEGAKFTGHGAEAVAATQNHRLDEFGRAPMSGVGQALAAEIEKHTGYETRVTVLGHLQRGGSSTAFDRVLGARLGMAAADMAHAGEFGKMVALQANKVVTLPIEVGTRHKSVPDDLYNVAKAFFA
jgi:ATP-dependent phosphofructokinase / diphosphate-dependent phosphofructokinase